MLARVWSRARTLAIVLSIAGAALIATATLTRHWLAYGGRDDGYRLRVGLRSAQSCVEGLSQGSPFSPQPCEVVTLTSDARLYRSDRLFVVTGVLGFYMGLLASALLLVLAGLMISQSRHASALGRALLPICGVAMIAAITFVISRPRANLAVSYGLPLMVAGCLLGIGALFSQRRASLPMAPLMGLATPARIAPIGAPCRHCHSPLRWVSAEARWFCDRCRRYA